ncbi:ferredoxin-type protein NapF [Alkalimarinus alittae]|uniref:Ferredoxin-type protein NapF n=1 Tax=Alkalimarinus alittae TaxID=2961619 RepID=A0ABY6N356_9ALTE|nr:ferredoxin-type protein NapF [Alkalimarinus alittae]UZE96437.1 ferredoxin-type protein NapF [Alkalimarinus alittae]
MSREVDLGRRSLFKGQYTPATSMLLPPWSVDQASFLDLCTRCGDCVTECPENVLTPGSGGFPTTNFKHNECTFCGDCVSACQAGALMRLVDRGLQSGQTSNQDTPWHQAPTINDRCLALQGVVCRSCGEACEPEAIVFDWGSLTDNRKGVATPTVNNDLCNGCGACISICPNDALTMQPLPNTSNRQTIKTG